MKKELRAGAPEQGVLGVLQHSQYFLEQVNYLLALSTCNILRSKEGAVLNKSPQILGMGTGLQVQKYKLGILWGWGTLKFWGYLGKNPRKSPNFGVGTGETISGIFTTLVLIVILHFRKGINRKIQLFACKNVDEKNPKNFAKPKNDSKVTKTLKAGTSQF